MFFWLTDLIDIVKDQLYIADYVKDEDPKLFVSEKTGRGPLTDNWLPEHWNEVRIQILLLKLVYISLLHVGERANSTHQQKYVSNVRI